MNTTTTTTTLPIDQLQAIAKQFGVALVRSHVHDKWEVTQGVMTWAINDDPMQALHDAGLRMRANGRN